MVGPGGATALWCRWYGRLVRRLPGKPPGAARAGTEQEVRAGGHGTITPAMLAGTFPGWRVSESGGTCRAHPDGPRDQDGPGPLQRVLTAPDLTALAEKLCLQERIDRTGRLSAGELAAVWGDEAGLPALTGAPS